MVRHPASPLYVPQQHCSEADARIAGGTKNWRVTSPPVTRDGSETLNAFYLAPAAGIVLTGSAPGDDQRYPGNFLPATDSEVGFVETSRAGITVLALRVRIRVPPPTARVRGGDRRA
jgi:hypothetical protein